MSGVFAIAAPSIHLGKVQIVSYAVLMGAAAAWAIPIVFVRSHRFAATALAIAPWQMLVAAVVLLPVVPGVEGSPPSIGAIGIASLAYVGPIATAFAYWAVVEAGRYSHAASVVPLFYMHLIGSQIRSPFGHD